MVTGELNIFKKKKKKLRNYYILHFIGHPPLLTVYSCNSFFSSSFNKLDSNIK